MPAADSVKVIMPWFEVLRCVGCGREWDHIDFAESVTVGTIDFERVGTFTLSSCPRCFLRLRVQREFDGNSWRHWCRTLPPTPPDLAGKLVALVADRISAILATRRTIYQPVVIELDRVDCVRCGVPLVVGPLEPPLPECPHCGGRQAVRTGGGGIVTLIVPSSPAEPGLDTGGEP